MFGLDGEEGEEAQGGQVRVRGGEEEGGAERQQSIWPEVVHRRMLIDQHRSYGSTHFDECYGYPSSIRNLLSIIVVVFVFQILFSELWISIYIYTSYSI